MNQKKHRFRRNLKNTEGVDSSKKYQKIPKIVNAIMKAELILPIDCLRGMLRKDGYYFRIYKGTQVVQRCPTKWKDTPARKAARQHFAQTWGQRYKKQ